MLNKKIVVLILLNIIFVNPLMAKNNGHEELARKLYETSSIYHQIRQVPGFYKENLKQYKNTFTPESVYLQFKLIDSLYNREIPSKKHIGIIKRALTSQEIISNLKWLNSSLGEKISKFEVNNAHERKVADFYHFQQEIEDKPLSLERKRLFYQIEGLIRSTDMMFAVAKKRLRVYRKLLYSPKNQAILNKRDSEEKDDVQKEMIYERSLIWSQFALRKCSNKELIEYIQFLKTKAAQKMIQAEQQIMMATLAPETFHLVIKQADLPLIAKEVNKELPKVIGNQKFRQDFVTAKRKMLVYHYTLLDQKDNDANVKQLRKKMFEAWEEEVCRGRVMTLLSRSGISLRHLYFDSEKRLVMDIDITPAVCGF